VHIYEPALSQSKRGIIQSAIDGEAVLVSMRTKRILPAIFTSSRNSLVSSTTTTSSAMNKFETGSLPRKTASRRDSFYESIYAELENGGNTNTDTGKSTPISSGVFRARYEDAVKG